MGTDRSDGATIRDSEAHDAAAIASIHNETIRARNATMELEEKTTEGVAAWLAGMHPSEAVLVLELDGAVIGWGVIKRYSDRPGYTHAGETSVYLRRSVLRRGLGTRLKKAVMRRARELGYHHLVARVWADNEASIAYNERLGYEMVGRQREIGFVDGTWRDIAVLQCLLDEVEL